MLKKLALSLLLGVSSLAMSALDTESLEFVDKNGNPVPHGSTITLTEVTQEEEFGEVFNVMYSGLSLCNKVPYSQIVRINVNISRLDNGNYEICFPVVCISRQNAGMFSTLPGEMEGEETRSLLTEWFPMETGGCDVTLSVEIMEQNGGQYVHLDDGPTVTLKYRNGITDQVPGDVTGNGSVDVADVNAVINVMLGKDSISASDVDNNGSTDVADVNAVINIMLGK